MDAQQFFSEFGHIASAPEGMQRLREMILSLAMQGKLVPQFPNESPADVLLQQVDADRKRLIKSGAIKSHSPLPEISAKEVTHSLPATWAWVRFGEIALHNSGKTLDSMRNNGQPRDYITTSNLYWGRFDLGNVRKMLIRDEELEKCTARKNDLLICEGGEAGRAAVWNFESEVCFQNHIHRARFFGGINPFFAYRFFEKLNSTGEINQHRKGIGISNMSSKALAMIPVPLPPYKEQARIVAKVDELMSLCDKLEIQQQDRQKLCNQTRTTFFRALADAQTPQDLADAWRSISANDALLLDTPESVDSYKGAILDLAMAGMLLTHQEKPKSTGHELLEEIERQRTAWSTMAKDQEQKEALAMQKKIRVQQIEPPDTLLPDHWTWGSFLQISQAVVDCHNKTAPYVNEGIHLIRTTDIRNGRMILKYTRKVSMETYAYWSHRMPPKPGDVFFTREAPMGEAAIVPDGETVCLGQRSMLLRLFPELFNNQFLVYAIYSPSFQARMIEAAIGMTVKHLRVGGVEDLMVPVPPKTEQDQIVAIIDRLFAHCDHLAQELAKKQKMGSNLAKASVEALTGIRTEEEEELKAPKTEGPARGQSPTRDNTSSHDRS